MDTTITQENMMNILFKFGAELEKNNKDTAMKLAVLGEFAIILLATIAYTMGNNEEEALHAVDLAYMDLKERVKLAGAMASDVKKAH